MFGWLKKNAVTTYTLDKLAEAFAGFIGWGTYSGMPVSERTALDITAVFCAARVIAEGNAQAGVRVVKETIVNGRSFMKVQPDHPVQRLLTQKPNDWQTPFEFIEGMVFNAVLGKGAIAIKNTVNGQVRELLPVPSASWTVEQLPDWSLRIRIDYADKTHGYFDRSQVLYMRGPGLNGFTALPAYQLARQALGLSGALEKQQAKLAGAGGKPSGVLSFGAALSDDSRDKLKTEWQTKFGPDGEGGIAILDGDAKFFPLTMTSVDAQHLESRRFQIEEIARAFRVQPIMLMQSDKAATFASAEQMFRMHVIHTLMPWMVRFEQALTRDVIGLDTGFKADFDERSLLRGDFKDMAEFYTKALGAGGQPAWMTQNEVRADQGLEPDASPSADKLSAGAMSPAQPKEA